MNIINIKLGDLLTVISQAVPHCWSKQQVVLSLPACTRTAVLLITPIKMCLSINIVVIALKL